MQSRTIYRIDILVWPVTFIGRFYSIFHDRKLTFFHYHIQISLLSVHVHICSIIIEQVAGNLHVEREKLFREIVRNGKGNRHRFTRLHRQTGRSPYRRKREVRQRNQLHRTHKLASLDLQDAVLRISDVCRYNGNGSRARIFPTASLRKVIADLCLGDTAVLHPRHFRYNAGISTVEPLVFQLIYSTRSQRTPGNDTGCFSHHGKNAASVGNGRYCLVDRYPYIVGCRTVYSLFKGGIPSIGRYSFKVDYIIIVS